MKHFFALITAAAMCSPAWAATYNFTAELQSVERTGQAIGDTVVDQVESLPLLTGTITIDGSFSAPSGIGGTAYALLEVNFDQISFVDNFRRSDRLTIVADNQGGSTNDFIFTTGGFFGQPAAVYEVVFVVLEDATGTVLSDESLPASLDRSDWTTAELTLSANRWNGSSFDGQENATYEFTRFDEPPAVPLPATLSLLVTAFGAFAWMRRLRYS